MFPQNIDHTFNENNSNYYDQGNITKQYVKKIVYQEDFYGFHTTVNQLNFAAVKFCVSPGFLRNVKCHLNWHFYSCDSHNLITQ